MDPYVPFTGVLLLPDKAFFGSKSPATFADGRPAAMIRWSSWSLRARFEIRDPTEQTLLATGSSRGVLGQSYEVSGPDGQLLLHLKIGFWGVSGRSTVTLPTGRSLRTTGNWSARKFSITDESGATVAHLVDNSSSFSMRPDGLAFEMSQPVFSVVQAIGLAQCMRGAAEAHRAATTNST